VETTRNAGGNAGKNNTGKQTPTGDFESQVYFTLLPGVFGAATTTRT
jgi:hypothetical protein